MNNTKEATSKEVYLYSTGNIANTAIFNFVGTYIMFYYTDILGIPGTIAGTIFLVARIIDAMTDPIMGMIIDHTNNKHLGKYRPYIIFGAPFLGAIFVAMFTMPSFSLTGRIIYAYTAYILYSIAWTIVQIPQLALPIILSNNVARRTKIQAIFQALGNVGALAVTALAIPLLNYFGGDTNPQAWTTVAVIFAVGCTIIFIFSAMSVRRLDVYNPVQAKKKTSEPKMSFGQKMRVITTNLPLMLILISFGTDSLAIQIGNALNMYFFKYNMVNKTNLMGLINWALMIFSFVLIFIVDRYVSTFGKKYGIIIAETLAIAAAAGLYFTPSTTTWLVMVWLIASALIGAINNMLSRSAVLDSANWAEWKTGVNGSALVSSTFTFVNKFSQAIGVFIMGHVLDYVGYQPLLPYQSKATLDAILNMKTLVPIAAFICSVVAMSFYPITKKKEKEMESFITEKRAQEATELQQMEN